MIGTPVSHYSVAAKVVNSFIAQTVPDYELLDNQVLGSYVSENRI